MSIVMLCVRFEGTSNPLGPGYRGFVKHLRRHFDGMADLPGESSRSTALSLPPRFRMRYNHLVLIWPEVVSA